jgi:hypothetical protein
MFRKKTLFPYLGQKINIWSNILLSTVVGVPTYRHTRRHLTKYYKLNNHIPKILEFSFLHVKTDTVLDWGMILRLMSSTYSQN